MNYQAAERFLLSLSNIPRHEYMNGTRATRTFLKRLQYFLTELGNPEKKIPHYIHVTGTSGKGSVATYLASILSASGQKTGLYVSPHPSRLTERWLIDGRAMGQGEFARIITKFKPLLDEYLRHSPYDMVSFFDLTTAIALAYFAEKHVDWAVIEVGCGGRYDSTNVIPHKDIAVITTIGLDHAELIGPTKKDIAREKAGIIKPGAAVFTIETNPEILGVVAAEARKQKVATVNVSPLRAFNNIERHSFLAKFTYGGQDYILPHLGTHQITNAALAIDIAQSLGLEYRAIARGLGRAEQPLRLEVAQSNPLIILDGAHNPDKMATTVAAVADLAASRRGSVHLVIGFSDNKDTRGMIRQLAKLQPRSVATTRATTDQLRKTAHPRIMADRLRGLLASAPVQPFLDPDDAYDWSRRRLKRNDILLVTGSIFLSGQLRLRLTKNHPRR
ncbi:MAG: FolC bifunctional protein [Candidatus Magasanikbacteria bacterium GW2011_GWA2_56_11]|uniref:tetrahydrofolate synthase n=1 Tax=Candidatus Magasanikbacteria bacterium GW2011_GWA2_56_11 TaxID=1619044 RepID=A0A0G1YDI2_9BACT|nr:MAG: FolC bifunctional protein [Candidatus Magasanikbacteria bacterium GW2011_GWA2_56_11]